MYHDWATKGLSPTEVNAFVNPSPRATKNGLQDPSSARLAHMIDHVSINQTQLGSGTLRGNALSTHDSAASSTSGTRKYLQAQKHSLNNACTTDAGKNLLWPGATPYFGASITPKSLRAPGGRSGPLCSIPASSVQLAGLPFAISGNVLPELS